MGDAQSEVAGVSAELHERLPQLKAQVEDVASARLPGLQRQLLTLGDSTNAMWEVINGLVQGGESGASREDDFGEAGRGAPPGCEPEP